jgi:plastocyanin
MKKQLYAAVAALAIGALVLAACGGDDSTASTSAADAESGAGSGTTGAASGGPGGTVSIAAEPDQLAFTKTEITAPAGNDTIELDNPSTTAHNVEIEDSSGEDIAETDTISSGKTTTTADLAPGTYTFYCAVPGHREAGMEGTITVK